MTCLFLYLKILNRGVTPPKRTDKKKESLFFVISLCIIIPMFFAATTAIALKESKRHSKQMEGDESKATLTRSFTIIYDELFGSRLELPNKSIEQEKSKHIYKNIPAGCLQYEDIDIFGFGDEDISDCCAMFHSFKHNLLPKKGVIRTQKEYESFQRSIYEKFIDSENCFSLSYGDFVNKCAAFPPIDFSKKTLLWNLIIAGGCRVEFNKSICLDDKSKKVIYHVVVDALGCCASLAISFNFVLTPKIPDDYSVEITETIKETRTGYGCK